MNVFCSNTSVLSPYCSWYLKSDPEIENMDLELNSTVLHEEFFKITYKKTTHYLRQCKRSKDLVRS